MAGNERKTSLVPDQLASLQCDCAPDHPNETDMLDSSPPRSRNTEILRCESLLCSSLLSHVQFLLHLTPPSACLTLGLPVAREPQRTDKPRPETRAQPKPLEILQMDAAHGLHQPDVRGRRAVRDLVAFQPDRCTFLPSSTAQPRLFKYS